MGITDLRDESDKDGIRVVIETKRDAVPEVILNQLYKHTQLQDTFGLILLALVNGVPKIMPLKEVLTHFVDFRHEVVVRRTEFELREAEARAHLLEGLKIALDNIDEVIKIIRGSKNPLQAKEGLMNGFNLSEIQAQAILDMRLQKLTGMEVEKVVTEYKEVIKMIAHLKGILERQKTRMDIIKGELLEIRVPLWRRKKDRSHPCRHRFFHGRHDCRGRSCSNNYAQGLYQADCIKHVSYTEKRRPRHTGSHEQR